MFFSGVLPERVYAAFGLPFYASWRYLARVNRFGRSIVQKN